MRVQLVHLLVDHVNGGVDGRCGFALQVGIERGVDAQAFAVEVALAQLLHQLIVHQVDKVRRFAGVHAGCATDAAARPWRARPGPW